MQVKYFSQGKKFVIRYIYLKKYLKGELLKIVDFVIVRQMVILGLVKQVSFSFLKFNFIWRKINNYGEALFTDFGEDSEHIKMYIWKWFGGFWFWARPQQNFYSIFTISGGPYQKKVENFFSSKYENSYTNR